MPEPDPQKLDEFREEALSHLDALYGLGLRLTGGDEARAEDLVREAMLDAWRSWESFEVGTNCRAWLMAIVRDTFIDEFRKREDRRPRDECDDVEERSVREELREADTEEAFFQRIGDDEVVRAIQGLEDELRVPLVLSDLEGLTYAEVAEALGIPVGTVKSRLFRARRRLQRELYDCARETGDRS